MDIKQAKEALRRAYLTYTARDEAGGRHVLVYDTAHGLWHRQDDADIMAFAVCGGALYGLTRSGALLDLTGGSGEPEETVRWMAETGELGLSAPDSKYLTRLELRVQPERRARLEALVSYDGGAGRGHRRRRADPGISAAPAAPAVPPAAAAAEGHGTVPGIQPVGGV